MAKFGVLGYEFSFKKATNVGDYIQSLAALQFFDDNDESEIKIVNRELLSSYECDEKIFLIMNGWFMHKPETWPPSSSIAPVFVSFHLNSSVREYFKENNCLEYLKKYSPIGCRDTSTMNFLKENEVDAFFSGCLTLTLNKNIFKKSEKTNRVLLCDLAQGRGSFRFLFRRIDLSFLGKILRIPRVAIDKVTTVNSSSLAKKIIKALPNHRAEYATTQLPSDSSDQERFEVAREYLDLYASSSLVITSRIHVALPCLALGTPVLFVDPKIDQSRFPGLIDLFNVMTIDDLRSISDLELSEKLQNLDNSDKYLVYRNSLIEKCEKEVERFKASFSSS